MKASSHFNHLMLVLTIALTSLNALAENPRLIKASAKLERDQGAFYYEFTVTQTKPYISIKNAKVILFIKGQENATQVIEAKCTDKNDILKNLEQLGRFNLSNNPEAKNFFALSCPIENKGEDFKELADPFSIFVFPSEVSAKEYDLNQACKTNFLGTSQPIFALMPNVCYEDFSAIENPKDYILKELSR